MPSETTLLSHNKCFTHKHASTPRKDSYLDKGQAVSADDYVVQLEGKEAVRRKEV